MPSSSAIRKVVPTASCLNDSASMRPPPSLQKQKNSIWHDDPEQGLFQIYRIKEDIPESIDWIGKP
jgi:hypothetical protein